MSKKTIGIIGFGNMGSAIAEQIKSSYTVSVFDKDKNKTQDVCGLKVAENIQELVKSNEVVILAVKPQDVDSVLEEIKPIKIRSLISIAAGISTSYLKKRLGEVRVVRAMPNLPIKVGKGVICIAEDTLEPEDRLLSVIGAYDSLGRIFYIQEKMMNAATAVSGSGPGFFFVLVESIPAGERERFAKEIFAPSLSAAAQAVGFDKEMAQEISIETALGSLALLEKSGLSLEALCARVTSKGGTTEAGLKKLQGNIEYLSEAVEAAKERAEELSKKE